MTKHLSAAIATLLFVCAVGQNLEAAQKFIKLSGPQIRAKLPGMEITDEAHWADVFAANGTLTSYSMLNKTIGKWRVQKDELCLDRSKDDRGCYQVWLAGRDIELRRDGSVLLQGVLQKKTARE